jgi:hypothetical protein
LKNRQQPVPEPLTLLEDLPAHYRAYVGDLAGTLTDGEVAGRACDDVLELLDAVVVSWDADLGAHQLEIRKRPA